MPTRTPRGTDISARRSPVAASSDRAAASAGDARTDRSARGGRQTASERIYEQLRDDILMGAIPAGALLNQSELAAASGVSVVPVREALLRLKAERLVDSQAYRRYVVRAMDDESVMELLDVRAVLEDFSLRRREITAEMLTNLAAIHQQMSMVEDLGQWIELDKHFHEILCGPWTETAHLVRQLRDQIQQYITRVAEARDRRAAAQEEHWGILTSLQEGDVGSARELLAAHIASTRSLLAASLASDRTGRARTGGLARVDGNADHRAQTTFEGAGQVVIDRSGAVEREDA